VPSQDRDTPHAPDDPSGEHAQTDGREDPVDRVIAGLGAISAALDRYRHAFGADHGLSGTEVVALVHLFQEHTATAGELAARTGLTPGAMTALLDRLERRGYLTRVRPPDNRRTLRIELTRGGWALRRAAFDPVESLLRTTASQPDAPNLKHLAYGLEQTAGVIEAAR
jgi:DNA-binding MarR family transcriptional regulator